MNNCCKYHRRLFENVDTETIILLSEVASRSLWAESVVPVSDLCLKNQFLTQAI